MLSGRGRGSAGPGPVEVSPTASASWSPQARHQAASPGPVEVSATDPVPDAQLAVSAWGAIVVDSASAAAGSSSSSATWRTAATSARWRSTRTRQAPQPSTCRRIESGTAPPPTRSSSSWSLGQGIESISQVLQVAGAELPDPGQDARTVDVDGAGGQAQLAGDLGAGPTL